MQGFFTWDPKIASKGSDKLSEIENSFGEKVSLTFILVSDWSGMLKNGWELS